MGRVENYCLSAISVDEPSSGVGPSLLRGALRGLSGLYDVGLETYLTAERVGLRRRDRLPVPVLSVGNLTVGGTGKTPMTAYLCNQLAAMGKRVAILSRGHGGSSQDARVVSNGDGGVLLDAEDAGDEPVLLARLCSNTPVLVGKDRRLSGREALRRWALDAIILDDGFQFWQLARDLDLVLLDGRRPFDNGYPLPRGLLREPIRHINRAGVVVVTRADSLTADDRDSLRDRIAALAPAAALFFARHSASSFIPLGSTSTRPEPLSALRGRRVIALSGIAQPESFHRTLRDEAGVEIATTLTWSDHHAFMADDVAAAERLAIENRVDAVIMTEKDAVKWPIGGQSVPYYAMRIALQVEDETRFFQQITQRLFKTTTL